MYKIDSILSLEGIFNIILETNKKSEAISPFKSLRVIVEFNRVCNLINLNLDVYNGRPIDRNNFIGPIYAYTCLCQHS